MWNRTSFSIPRYSPALRAAANKGYIDVLTVLHDVYELTAEDARAKDNKALRAAASKDYIDVLTVFRDLLLKVQA